MAGDEHRDPGELVPRPDPSRLTTAQLHHELGGLERLINERFTGTGRVMDERFRSIGDRLTRIEKLAGDAAASQLRNDARYEALKERLDRGEGTTAGRAGERTERRLDAGQLIQGIAVVLTMIGLIIVAFHK